MIIDILAERILSDKLKKKFEDLENVISNTPLIELLYTYQDKIGKIYIKCEHANLTGSIKDRMALYILKKAYEGGEIVPGNHIIETSSGNAGVSFAAIGAALRHPVKIMMPDWMCQESADKIREMGAVVDLITKKEGGFLKSIEIHNLLADRALNVFLPNQLQNNENPEAYQNTVAPEIWKQLKTKNIHPDAFVAQIGTGGTIMGIGRFLKEQDSDIKIHPIEILESAVLTEKDKNNNSLKQRNPDKFVPAFFNFEKLDKVISVDERDAALMAQKLSKELDFQVGISSGANVIGAIKLQQSLGNGVNVITVFPDSFNKQLNNFVMEEEAVKTGFLSVDIDLINYQAIG